MIVVRVELWSAITGQRSEIARMVIDNIGGTRTMGDYRVQTMRGRSEEDLHKSMISILTEKSKANRIGNVKNHARLSLHVWHLIGKALNAVGYVSDAVKDTAE